MEVVDILVDLHHTSAVSLNFSFVHLWGMKTRVGRAVLK